jgi:hypothetical protein
MAAVAAAAEQNQIQNKLHVLDKLWAVTLVLRYACRAPRRVFLLALVSRAFRECMLEYDQSRALFDRIFDARLSEEHVKSIWMQAIAIMQKQERAQQQQQPFDPDLLAEMVAGMKKENERAAIEFDAAEAAPRQDRDNTAHAEWGVRCVPHPAAAKHRWCQQLCACAAAFRDVRHVSARGRVTVVDWFSDPVFVEADRGAQMGVRFYVARNSKGFLNALRYAGQPELDGHLDASLLPRTLQSPSSSDYYTPDFAGTHFVHRHPEFLVQLAGTRITRLELLAESGLRCRLSFADLPRTLHDAKLQCYLWCDAPQDFAALPDKMTALDVAYSELEAEFRGVAPARMTLLCLYECKITLPQAQPSSLRIYQ